MSNGRLLNNVMAEQVMKNTQDIFDIYLAHFPKFKVLLQDKEVNFNDDELLLFNAFHNALTSKKDLAKENKNLFKVLKQLKRKRYNSLGRRLAENIDLRLIDLLYKEGNGFDFKVQSLDNSINFQDLILSLMSNDDIREIESRSKLKDFSFGAIFKNSDVFLFERLFTESTILVDYLNLNSWRDKKKVKDAFRKSVNKYNLNLNLDLITEIFHHEYLESLIGKNITLNNSINIFIDLNLGANVSNSLIKKARDNFNKEDWFILDFLQCKIPFDFSGFERGNPFELSGLFNLGKNRKSVNSLFDHRGYGIGFYLLQICINYLNTRPTYESSPFLKEGRLKYFEYIKGNTFRALDVFLKDNKDLFNQPCAGIKDCPFSELEIIKFSITTIQDCLQPIFEINEDFKKQLFLTRSLKDKELKNKIMHYLLENSDKFNVKHIAPEELKGLHLSFDEYPKIVEHNINWYTNIDKFDEGRFLDFRFLAFKRALEENKVSDDFLKLPFNTKDFDNFNHFLLSADRFDLYRVDDYLDKNVLSPKVEKYIILAMFFNLTSSLVYEIKPEKLNGFIIPICEDNLLGSDATFLNMAKKIKNKKLLSKYAKSMINRLEIIRDDGIWFNKTLNTYHLHLIDRKLFALNQAIKYSLHNEYQRIFVNFPQGNFRRKLKI